MEGEGRKEGKVGEAVKRREEGKRKGRGRKRRLDRRRGRNDWTEKGRKEAEQIVHIMC